MPVLKNLIPNYRFKKITDINPEFFNGAELIIVDLDNTLVFPGTVDTKKEIIDWLSNIKKKYHCIIFSNSFSFFKRAERLSEIFNCELFLSKNKKPFKKLFYQMQKKYNFDAERVFVVGDRIFTDVLFGNTNNAKTVLIDPLTGKENIFIKTTRVLEYLTVFISKNFNYNKSNKK